MLSGIFRSRTWGRAMAIMAIMEIILVMVFMEILVFIN
jgi:hypothetical protein